MSSGVWRACRVGVATLLVACAPTAGGADLATDGGTTTTVRRCVDVSGASVACPITVTPTGCPNTSAAGCTAVTVEEVRVGADAGGACLHLVVANRCGRTVYSDTCIEHLGPGGPQWQCWRSTTSAGGTIDVGQCDATGRYHRYSSLNRGEVDILQVQCAHP